MTRTSIVAGIVTAQNCTSLVGICKTDFGGCQLDNVKEASRLHTATNAPGKNSIVIVAILHKSASASLKKTQNTRHHRVIIPRRLLRNERRGNIESRIGLRILLTFKTKHEINDQLRPLPKARHLSSPQMVPSPHERYIFNHRAGLDTRGGEFLGG
jgi:hypothetical protein